MPTQNFRRAGLPAPTRSAVKLCMSILLRKVNLPTIVMPDVSLAVPRYNDESGNFVTAGFEYETIWDLLYVVWMI